jgi:asparagine N-glycosylation enzyme membrane subunit Stt3
VRVSVFSRVFVEGRVLTHDPDALYHLQRIEQTVQAFPRVPVHDAYLNWPEGAVAPWALGFDWLAAAWVLLLGGGGGDEFVVARIAAFFPVVLGVAVVGLAVGIARQVAPRPIQASSESPGGLGTPGKLAILATAWLAALLPRGVMASQLGRVDHHVAEAGVMAGLGLGVLWALAEHPARPRSRRSWLAFEAGVAAAVTLAGWLFTGSVLYVAIACGVLIVLRLDAARHCSWRPLWGSGFPGLAVASLALLAINAGLVPAHGHPFDYRYPDYLQPALHGLLALGCLAAAAVVRFGPRGRTRRQRVAVRAGCLLGIGLVAAVLAYPMLGADTLQGLDDWLARSDPWLAGIAEFQPVFPSWAVWRPDHWAALYHFNGWVGMLAPIAIPLGLRAVWRGNPRAGRALTGLTLPLVFLSLVQNRFGQVLTPYYAVVTGFALAWGAEALARRAAPGLARLRSELAAAGKPAFVLGALMLVVLAPDRVILDELRWDAVREPTAIEAAALFLRSHPPEPDREGALAAWYYGHTVRVLGKRPVLTAGFGPWTGVEGFESAQRFMRGTEAELIDLMERRRLGHVVTGMRAQIPAPGDSEWRDDRPFVRQPTTDQVALNPGHFQRSPLASLILGGSGMPGIDVGHVQRLRPVYATPWSTQAIGLPIFQLWVYERVEGARVTGRVRPRARVIARTGILLHGERVPYTAWTDADANGDYELVIPLPTGVRTPELSTEPRYAVFVDDTRVGVLSVSEVAVRNGSRLRVAME